MAFRKPLNCHTVIKNHETLDEDRPICIMLNLGTSLASKLSVVVDQAEANTDRISELKHSVSAIHPVVELVKGILARKDKQIDSLASQVVGLKAKLMENSIIITGIEGNDEGEDVVQSAMDFLKEKNESATV